VRHKISRRSHEGFLTALVVPVSILMCIVACPRGLSAQISLTQTFCNRAAVAAELYAYPAIPGSANCGGYICELWDSNGLSASMPGAVKFTVPTIVDGYILVGGGSPSYFGPNSTACPAPPPNNGVPTSQCAGQLTILH